MGMFEPVPGAILNHRVQNALKQFCIPYSAIIDARMSALALARHSGQPQQTAAEQPRGGRHRYDHRADIARMHGPPIETRCVALVELAAVAEIEGPCITGNRRVPRGRPVQVGLNAGKRAGIGQAIARLDVASGQGGGRIAVVLVTESVEE